MNYRREIDGLRALAVIPVMLFHAGFATFHGGFVGVDVFFVISGYLITTIIVLELEQGRFSIVNFYERRARRILPALFLVMLVCMPLAWLWMWPRDMKDFAGSVVAVSLFFSNILFWLKSSYFDTAAELKPLLHTWSLAVEEQYYVCFPLFLMLTWRLAKRWILAVLIVAGLTSLTVAQWAATAKPAAAFYLLPSRGWELLVGAFAAFYLSKANPPKHPRPVREIGGWLGLLLIVGSVFIYSKDTPFPGLYALAPTVGAVLIILFVTQQTAIGKLIGNRAFVGIGLISYSAYLWHQPLFAFARLENVTAPYIFATLFLCSMALAYLSWKYIEKPFRSREQISRRSIFILSAVMSATFVSLGVFAWQKDGFSEYYASHRLNEVQRNNLRLINAQTSYDMYAAMVDDGACKFWSKDVDAQFVQRFQRCSAEHGKALVVVGDSHAMNVYNIVAKSNVSNFVAGITQGGCRPHNNEPYCQYTRVLEFAKGQANAISALIFHQSGAYLMANKDRVIFYDSENSRDSFDLYETNIKKVSEYLTSLSKFVDVIWLGPIVEARVDYRDLRRFDDGFRIDESVIRLFEKTNSELVSLHQSGDYAYKYVPFEDIVTIGPTFLKIGDCLTFMDKDHFSRCGEDIVAEHLRTNRTLSFPRSSMGTALFSKERH